MISQQVAEWLEILWEAVCIRAARPIAGILLDQNGIQNVASSAFKEFFAKDEHVEPNLESMLRIIARPTQRIALNHVAKTRSETSNQELHRDLKKARWETNPNIVKRDSEGTLTAPEWTTAEPILWNRATPIYFRLVRCHDLDFG